MNIQHKLFFLTLLFGLLCLRLVAGEDLNKLPSEGGFERLNLKNCVQIGLLNNPFLAELKAKFDSANAKAGIAASRLRPVLGLRAGIDHHINDQSLVKPRRLGGPVPYVDDHVYGDLVFSMPVYNSSRYQNLAEASKLDADSARMIYQRRRQELIYDISSLFNQMLGQIEVIDSLKFSKDVMINHQKRVAAFVESKKAAKVDLLRTEVRLADIEQKIIQEDNRLRVMRIELLNMLGVEVNFEDNCFLEGELVLPEKVKLLKVDFETVLDQRKDYVSVYKKLLARQRILRAVQAERRPEIDFRGSYGSRHVSSLSDSRAQEVGQIGIQINLPVFDGGRIRSEEKQAGYELSVLNEQLRRLKLQIKAELRVARYNVESAQARIEVTRKSIRQARESLRIEQEKYHGGKGVIVDVLDAQSALLESQTSYFRALAEYHSAVVQFKLATGDLS